MEVVFYDLTERQQLIKEYLQIQSKLFGCGFYNAKDRNIGKTVIINNLGLEYQALGYEVYIATPTFFNNEYIAYKRWENDIEKGRGIRFSDKAVILVDELDSEKAENLLMSLKRHYNGENVKVLGFVNF